MREEGFSGAEEQGAIDCRTRADVVAPIRVYDPDTPLGRLQLVALSFRW